MNDSEPDINQVVSVIILLLCTYPFRYILHYEKKPMSLKQIRKKSGYKQLDIAKFLGVTQVTYHRYESGEREPSIEQLKKLSAFFGVSIDCILDNCVEEKDVLSQYERQLIEAARNADKRARTDALMLLKANDRGSI